ncbi:putative SnoaL-like aldol condensation-catalyzing enzyme [Variovorax boronicumulans]|uniref:nuclear transport factor 2 family protein n=1 Tax=Variovorax boronicumulans TaxID=436515 RepID=UPI00278B3659|nr:putative SnoaL-like aldol condensation-catalyzing enzyme [Variovorax boronicumulans]
MQRITWTAIAASTTLFLAACAPMGGAKQSTTSQQEANRQTVLAFYEKGLNQKDADAALQYVGNRYVQHNPVAADGPEGFRKFVAFLREKFPKSHSAIKRSFVEGDYVILHVHAVREPGTRGTAIIDIFKLENGKIVEHWDVAQPVPETAANNNGMF